MIRSVKHVNVKGKKVFLRVDFNVPIKGNRVVDDSRIRAAIPTILLLLKKGASQVIIASSRGRPKGIDPLLSMLPIAKHLSKLLNQKVVLTKTALDDTSVGQFKKNRIILLENLRFFPEEEKNNPIFAKKLSSHADLYVNDAFGNAHRAHASMHAITRFLPSYAGLLLMAEITALSKLTKSPLRPFLVIIGGAKADKMSLVRAMLRKADQVIVGGVLANILLQARGFSLGSSLSDADAVKSARSWCWNKKLVLPTDVVVAVNPKSKSKIVSVNMVGNREIAYDIGPESVHEIQRIVKTAKTIFIAGPLGLFEIPAFSNGTFTIFKTIANTRAIKICGGGDSEEVITKLHLTSKFTDRSTGGGASLEFVEGKKLPGIQALEKSKNIFKKHK